MADEAGRAMLRRAITGLSAEAGQLSQQIHAMPDGRFQLDQPTLNALVDHLELAERELTRATRILDAATERLGR